VVNDQNVEIQILPKRCQIHSAQRLKKFIDPAQSKFWMKIGNKKKVKLNSWGTEGETKKTSQKIAN
jgi:hypothetical protein